MASPEDWSQVGYNGNPIAGNPEVVDGVARDFRHLQDLAAEAGTGLDAFLRKAENGGFEGQTADALREYIRSQLRTTFVPNVQRSFEQSAAATERYANALREAQGRAESAAARGGAVAIPPAGLVTGNAPAPWEQVLGLVKKKGPALPPELIAAKNDVRAEADFITAEAKIFEDALEEAARLVSKPIPKARTSGWQKFWKALEIIAMVVSVLALVFTGPLGLLAMGMNAVLFLKAVADYASGKTDATSLGLAALGLLGPSTKGLTTFGRMARLFKAGGALARRGLSSGLRAIPRTLSLGGNLLLQGGKLLLRPRTLAALTGQALTRWSSRFGGLASKGMSRVPDFMASATRMLGGALRSVPGFFKGMWQQGRFALRRDFFLSTAFVGGGMGRRLGAYAIINTGRAFDLAVSALLPVRYGELATFGYRAAFRMGFLERGLLMRSSLGRSITRGTGSVGGGAFDLTRKGLPTPATGTPGGNVGKLVLPGTQAWDDALDELTEFVPPSASLPRTPAVSSLSPVSRSVPSRFTSGLDDLVEPTYFSDLDTAGSGFGTPLGKQGVDVLDLEHGGLLPPQLRSALDTMDTLDALDELGGANLPGPRSVPLEQPQSAVTRLRNLDTVMGLDRTDAGLLKPLDDLADLADLGLHGDFGGLTVSQVRKMLDGEIDIVDVTPDGVILRIGKTDPVDVQVHLKGEVTVRVLGPSESVTQLPTFLGGLTGQGSPGGLGIKLDDLVRLLPDAGGDIRRARQLLGMGPLQTPPVTAQTGFPPLTLREIITGGEVGRTASDRFHAWLRVQNAEIELDTAGRELSRITELPDVPPLNRAQAELDLSAAELKFNQARMDFDSLGLNLDTVRRNVTVMMARIDGQAANLPVGELRLLDDLGQPTSRWITLEGGETATWVVRSDTGIVPGVQVEMLPDGFTLTGADGAVTRIGPDGRALLAELPVRPGSLPGPSAPRTVVGPLQASVAPTVAAPSVPQVHWLVRQDVDFTVDSLKSGMKTRLTEDGLVPVRTDGTVTPLQAVSTVNAKVFKENSPFTAFSPPGDIAKSYGSQEIGLDLVALSRDINGGVEGVKDLRIISHTQLQQEILTEIRLRVGDTQLDVPTTFSHMTSNKDIQNFLVQNGVTKGIATKVTPDIKALLQVRRDNTWLVQGSIPKQYLTGPYATVDSLKFVPTAPDTPFAAPGGVLDNAGRASGSGLPSAGNLKPGPRPDDFSMSQVDLEELRGVKLVRQDDFHHLDVDIKGLRKSHFDSDLGMIPANPEGRTTAFQHVAGAENAARKSNSPFTSFAATGGHKVYGGMEFTLDAYKLGTDIKSGKLPSVGILPAHGLEKLIDNQIEWTIGKRLDFHSVLTADSTRQDVVSFLKANDVNLVGKGGKDMSSKLASDVRVLLNTTRDQEWLVKGVIPKKYLDGPHPTAASADTSHALPSGTSVHALDEAAGNLRLTDTVKADFEVKPVFVGLRGPEGVNSSSLRVGELALLDDMKRPTGQWITFEPGAKINWVLRNDNGIVPGTSVRMGDDGFVVDIPEGAFKVGPTGERMALNGPAVPASPAAVVAPPPAPVTPPRPLVVPSAPPAPHAPSAAPVPPPVRAIVAKAPVPPPTAGTHGLGRNLDAGTPVVRHEPGGDTAHWRIEGKDAFGRYRIRNTLDQSMSVTSPADRAWVTLDNAAASRTAFETAQLQKAAEQLKKADLQQGGLYLSSGYRSINPLLAAFEKAGYTAPQVRHAAFDFSARADEVLENWKRIAMERGYATPEVTESWDLQDLHRWHDSIKAIHRAWEDFSAPVIPGNTVVRGDSQQILSSFDGVLNPANYRGAGYHDVGRTISWPGIMSTTTGSAMTHNFVNSKAVIWKFDVPEQGHPGRVLGSENLSEAEVTFPVNTQIKINQVLVREGGFADELVGEFGDKAKVIVFADIVSGGETALKAGDEILGGFRPGDAVDMDVAVRLTDGMPRLDRFDAPPSQGETVLTDPQQFADVRAVRSDRERTPLAGGGFTLADEAGGTRLVFSADEVLQFHDIRVPGMDGFLRFESAPRPGARPGPVGPDGLPQPGVGDLAGQELRLTRVAASEGMPGSFRLEAADVPPARGAPGAEPPFTVERIENGGFRVTDPAGTTRWEFDAGGTFLARETALVDNDLGLPSDLWFRTTATTTTDGVISRTVGLVGPRGATDSFPLTAIDRSLQDRLPGGFTLTDSITGSRFHYDADLNLTFRDLPARDSSGFLRFTEGARNAQPTRLVDPLSERFPLNSIPEEDLLDDGLTDISELFERTLDEASGGIRALPEDPARVDLSSISGAMEFLEAAPGSHALQNLDLPQVRQLAGDATESLNRFPGLRTELLHDQLRQMTAQAHLGIRQGAATAMREYLNLPPATRLEDLQGGGSRVFGDFTVTPTPHGGPGGSRFTVTHTPTDLTTGFGPHRELLHQEVFLRGGPAELDGTKLGLTGRAAEGGWAPDSFQFVGTHTADDAFTLTRLDPNLPSEVRGGFTVTDAAGTTKWHYGPEGTLALRDVRLVGDRGVFRFEAGALDGVPQVLDTAGNPTLTLRAEQLDDGRIALIHTGPGTQPLERTVFDASGGKLLEETVAIRGKGGKSTGSYWTVDHVAGKGVRVNGDRTPFTGRFDTVKLETSPTGQFKLTGKEPGKVTLFEREVLKNGNTLHIARDRFGHARWTEFDNTGTRVRSGERIGDADQRTYHDVPDGSWRLLNTSDVRTYHKAVDGGLVRAEKGADGHWTWQRFDKNGVEALSGTRHWSANHVAFKDTFPDPATGLETVAQRRGQTWPFDGLHGSRMYQEYSLLPGHAPAGTRVDPGTYVGQGVVNAQIESLETLADGGSLLVKRFADMRPPAFMWKGAAGRNPFDGFFRDLFGGDSMNRVSHWTQTAADGTTVTGARLNPAGSNWVDIDQFGRIVRESRKLDDGSVIEIGRSADDPTRWAQLPEYRKDAPYELDWRNTTTGETGTRHADGLGQWRDVFTDSEGVQRVRLRSEGAGTREYLFDAPTPQDLARHDRAGIWVDRNSLLHVTGRRDRVGDVFVESSGSPYRTSWTWKAYDSADAATVLDEGIRKQNRGSLYSRTWDDSYLDLDRLGNVVRERNATDVGASWVDAVRQPDGTYTWTRTAPDGTVHSAGVRVYDDVAKGRWRDLIDDSVVRSRDGGRVREYAYEIVTPRPPAAPAVEVTRGTTLRDLLDQSARHFETPGTVRVDREAWKEYDLGKVFRERVKVDGETVRYREVDKQWGQWREYQNGHLVEQRVFDGRVYKTDAFGGLSMSGPAAIPHYLGGVLPKVGGDVGLPGDRAWQLIGREYDYRGADIEALGYLREVQDPWHGLFQGVRNGESVEMPMWQRELRSFLTTFSTGFVTDFTASLLITELTDKGDLKVEDVFKAMLSGTVGGTFSGGLNNLYNHTRLGYLKTSLGDRDWAAHPKQSMTGISDDWATDWAVFGKPTRWRGATYANTVGLATGALSGFVNSAISAAVFGVNGNEVQGVDALRAGAWGAAGSLFGGVSTGLARNAWHLATGARVFYRGGLGELGMNWAESALSRYLAFQITQADSQNGKNLPSPGRAFPKPATTPAATPPPPAPRPPADQPAAPTEGLELP